MRIELSDREIVIIASALDAAIREALRMDYLGALTEYTKARGEAWAWAEVDERATTRTMQEAHALLAKLASDSWGIATMDGGIFATRKTRSSAVAEAGFATPHHRERIGDLWEYTSEGGSSVTVGRVRDLIAAGFTFSCMVDSADPEPV